MASGSGVVQWEAEPSGDGAVTEEGEKQRALALESQGPSHTFLRGPVLCGRQSASMVRRADNNREGHYSSALL